MTTAYRLSLSACPNDGHMIEEPLTIAHTHLAGLALILTSQSAATPLSTQPRHGISPEHLIRLNLQFSQALLALFRAGPDDGALLVLAIGSLSPVPGIWFRGGPQDA
jgi:hypothetical protein